MPRSIFRFLNIPKPQPEKFLSEDGAIIVILTYNILYVLFNRLAH